MTKPAFSRQEVERIVCELMAELLGRHLQPEALRKADCAFFDFGGDSLLATLWWAEMIERFGIDLPFASVLGGYTTLVDAIQARLAGTDTSKDASHPRETWARASGKCCGIVGAGDRANEFSCSVASSRMHH